jgi:ligand-binding sensor domain-containing protein/signal transduction histidine kinase
MFKEGRGIWVMLKRLLFVIILSQGSAIYARQPEIEFRHLKVKDGLSQSWVKSICQDLYGFMWFGTNEGLNKYDGYSFTVYKNNPEDEHSISNNAIESIFEDKSGNLWVGTENGLNLYDRDNDRFIYNTTFSRRRVTGFLELKDGRMFMPSRNSGLYLYNPKNDSVISFSADVNDLSTLSHQELSCIAMDSSGNIWIGSSDGLNLLDTLTYKFTHFRHNKNDKNTIANSNIQSLCRDSKNRIWVGTQEGLSLLKYNKDAPEKSTFINYTNNPYNETSISNGFVLALKEDKEGRLWIGLQNGGLDIIDLNTFEENNCVFHHHTNNPDDNTSLSHNSIYSLYEDRNGSVWVGSYGDGVNMYNKLTKKFKHYNRKQNNPNSLTNNFVNALLDDGDYLWIGTDGGLNFFDKKNKKFKHFVHNPNDNKSLGSNSVCALEKDSKGNLWIGTWAGGLNLFNRKTNTFTRFRNDPNDTASIGSNNMFAILEDQDRNLWIGTMGGGLNLFNRKNKTFKRYINIDSDSSTITDDWVRTLFESSYGEIWLSSSMTVEFFDKNSERFIHFSHDRDNLKSISYDGANMFFEDSKKNLWIGTIGGLNVFNREDSTFSHYNQEHGLPNNQINGILEDEHGNLWISTNKGISKFINGINRPRNPIFKNYDVGDGLQGDEFRPRSYCKDKDGRMYFGGKNGFNVFHPDSLTENSYIPPLVITKFLLFNKSLKIGTKDSPLKRHINLAKKVVLSYKHTTIGFEYSALNFIVPEKNQYAIMLEGFNKEWNYVGNKREVTYTNLNPGTYTLRIKGSNNDGIWNEKGTSLKIIIAPPFWKTAWFRICITILIILSIYAVHIIRVRNIVAYGRELEIKVAERTRDLEKANKQIAEKAKELNKSNKELEDFAYIVSHDLKAPLRAINELSNWISEDYSDVLDKEGKENLGLLRERTQRMNNMIEGILEYSRVGRAEGQREKIDLNKLLEEVIDMLAPPDNIKIIVENKLPKYTADRTRLTELFENLLSNAIKYSGKPQGIIKVDCAEEESKWKFSVSDNGHGIEKKYWDKIFKIFQTLESDPKYKSTGIGLTIAKKIVNLYNGEIWVESEMGIGTTFYFTLPKQ